MSKCRMYPKAPNGVDSELFKGLIAVTKNRYKAVKLYYTLTASKEFGNAYPDIVLDKNLEPKLFEGGYVQTKSGEKIPLLGEQEFDTLADKSILESVEELANKLFNHLPKKLKNFIKQIGYFRAQREFSWVEFFDGVKNALSDKSKILLNSANTIHSLGYMIDHYLTEEERAELLKFHKVDVVTASQNEVDNALYDIAVTFLEWRITKDQDLEEREEELLLDIKRGFALMEENQVRLNEFFSKISSGFTTYGIAMPDFIESASGIIRSFNDRFGADFDSVSEAVERFKKAQNSIRGIMNHITTTPIEMKTKSGKPFYYCPSREEAEAIARTEAIKAFKAVEAKVKEKFKTRNPNPFKASSKEDRELIHTYYQRRAVVANFDYLMDMLYPAKKTRTSDAYIDAYREELDDMVSELESQTGTEVNINAETVGAEHINGERSQTASVKDFLSTIKKMDGSGYIRSRYAYLKTAQLLSGLDYNDKFSENLRERAKKLSNYDPTNDIHAIVEALLDVDSRATFDRSLFKGKTPEGRRIWEDKFETPAPGYFESDDLFVHRNSDGTAGATLRKNKNERTAEFYYRIQKTFGVSNFDVAVAGQNLQNSSLLSSIYSHFASLKESEFHYLEVEEEDYMTNVSYRKDKYSGVSKVTSENLKAKIQEAASKGTYKSIVESAMEESTDASKVSRFLRNLGLNDLANLVTDKTPRIATLKKDIVESLKRVQGEMKVHEAAMKRFNAQQEAFNALPKDYVESQKRFIYQIINNERIIKELQNQQYKEKLQKGSISAESVQALEEALNKTSKQEGFEGVKLVVGSLDEQQRIIYNAYINQFAPRLDVTKQVNTMLNNFAESLNEANEFQKPNSVFSKGKTRKYTLHNSSNAWYIINQMIKNIGYKSMLKFTNQPYYEKNLFISGVNTIKAWHDFDYTKTIDYRGREIDTSYSEDRMTGFFIRQFNGMFVDKLQFNDNGKGESRTYVQAFPTISNRTSIYGVEVEAKNREGIIEGLVQTIEQMSLRKPKSEVNAKVYNEDSTNLFRVLDPYLAEYGSIKAIVTSGDTRLVAEKIYDEQFKKKGEELAKAFIDMRIPLHKKLVSPALMRLLEHKDHGTFKKLANDGTNTKAVLRSGGKVAYAFSVEELLPIMQVFVANNYLNSYHLMQLTMGDPAFFKNGADIVKRASGAHAPGQVGRVHDKYAMPEKFRVLVVNDPVIGQGTIEESLKSLGFNEETTKELLSLFPKDYEPTDGFGLMLPKRRKDLVKGFGQEYGVTHISKPAHYEITDNGPVMMKYSSLELTDELCEMYPQLKTLRQNMTMIGADELLFASAVKVGQPSENASLEELQRGEFTIKDGVLNNAEGSAFNMKSVLTLSSKYYRLQHNPYHDLNSSVAYPTQLAYFLNVLGENVEMADRVYKATAALLSRRLANVNTKTSEEFRTEILKSMKGAGNERFRELLEASISLQFPEIAKQSFTKISAMFKNNVTSIRFAQSQKLVAQSDLGITKPVWDPVQKKFVASDQKLKRVKIGDRIVAECLLPEGALPPEVEEAVREGLKNGTDVFLSKADALAFRIPSSELHSAIAVKVVGFLSPMQLSGKNTSSNMIIVPNELMPIIGYDFDIDSFFTIQRQYVTKDGKRTYPGYPGFERNDWTFDPALDTEEMSDEEFEAYQKNIILDSFLEAITKADSETQKRMSAPISFKALNDDIDLIEEKMGGDKKDFDLSDPLDNYRAFESSFSGAKGVGIFAQAVKAMAYSIRSNNGEAPALRKQPGQIELTFNGKPLDKIDEGKGTLMNLWASMDSLLNSALDNVKLQILPRLNIGDNTFKALIAMRALGVDMETANRFMLLPFMRHYNKLRTKNEVTNATAALLNAKNQNLIQNFDLQPGQKVVFDVDDTLLNTTDTIEALSFTADKGKSKQQMFFTPAYYNEFMDEFQQKVTTTKLGESLREKIAQGIVDPADIHLVSKAPGRVKFLSEKFGIPESQIHPEMSTQERKKLKKSTGSEHLIDDSLRFKSGDGSSVELNQEDLEEWLEKTAHMNSIEDILSSGDPVLIDAMANYAAAYERLTAVGDAISDLANYLNIIRDLPVTDANTHKMLNLQKRIFDENGKVNETFPLQMDNFMDVNPHIKQYSKVFNTFWRKIQGMFHIHSTEAEAMVAQIAAKVRSNLPTEQLEEDIRYGYQDYVISTLEDYPEYRWDNEFNGFDQITPVKDKNGETLYGKDAYKQHVMNMVAALKNQFTNNKFLNGMAFVTDFKGTTLQMPGIHTMDNEDIIDLRNWFNKLSKYQYDFSTGTVTEKADIGYSNIQKSFLRYAILQYGMKFSTKNFSAVIPAEMIKPLDEMYNKALSSYKFREFTQEDFALQYMLKNPDSLRATSMDMEFAGYDETVEIHYDLKLSGARIYDQIVSVDDTFMGRVITKQYLRVMPPIQTEAGVYALYAEIGKENPNMPYQAGSSMPMEERFNGKHKHFKVKSLKDMGRLSYKHVAVGDKVSVSEYSDPLRTNIQFFEVVAITPKGIELAPAPAPVVEAYEDTYTPQPLSVKKKTSKEHQALKAILDRLQARTGMPYRMVDNATMEKESGENGIKGMVKDGEVLINLDLVTEDTPFHEYIHPFVHMLKTRNKEVYDGLVKELKESEQGRKVLESVKRRYPGLTEEQQIEEAIVELAGKYAAASNKINDPHSGLRRYLERFWNNISAYVSELLGSGKRISAEELKKISIKELGVLFEHGDSQIELASAPTAFSKIEDIYNEGAKVTLGTKPDGTEEDHYISPSGKRLNRITKFMENFLDRIVNQEKSLAERRADRLWKDLPKDTLLDTDLVDGKAMTYNQYVERLTGMYEKGRVKGKLIHKLIQLAMEPENTAKIMKEIEEINKQKLVKSWEYNWVSGIADQLLLKYGVNVNAALPERDKVKSEVTVASEELGISGTMDMLIEHPDGLFSILEWKSGISFNSRIFDGLLKYGNQTIDLTDNPKERAKLQVALYAVMLRINNPGMKFRDLRVAWVPNEWEALKEDPTSYVEVDSYIPMIKSFFRDEKALKEAGLSPDILQKIDPKGTLFQISAYSNYHSSSIGDLLKQGKTHQQIFELKMNKLMEYQAIMDESGKGLAALEKKIVKNGTTVIASDDKDKYLQLLRDVQELKKDPAISLENALDPEGDIGLFTRVFGNAGDVSNPMIRVWRKFRDERMLKANQEYYAKINKLRALLEPVMKEMGITESRTLGIMTGNYKEMYQWAYKYEERQGRGKIKRFVTIKDAEFNSLTKAQQELLKYVNSTIGEYFLQPDSYLNQGVMEVETKKGTKMLSHLELMNRFTSDKDKVDLFEGFMPKVPITPEEVRFKFGKGSNIAGAFNPKYIKDLWRRSTTFYEEVNYERWDVNGQALPIKFTGSADIEAREDYSDNLELVFSKWVQAMEHKKNMDHVYAMGKGIYNKMMDAPDTQQLKRTADFLDDIITKDVQGKIKQVQYTTKRWRARNFNGSQKVVSVDSILMFLNRWGSSVVMQFRPYTATGNVIHGMILETRRGFVGNIAKLTGIDGNYLEYTAEDLLVAEKEYLNLMKDAASGKLRENKLYMLAKEFDFHPNASLFAGNREFISMRNRILDPSNQFILHSIGEEYLSYMILAAQMSHMKLKDGRSTLDAYKVVKGADNQPVLQWDGGLRGYVRYGTGAAEHKVPIYGLTPQEVAKMKRVHENQQGSYRREELAAIEAYALGKMFTSLKRYLHRILFVGLGSTKPDDGLGRFVEKGEEGGVPIYEWEAQLIEGRYYVIGKAILAVMSAGKLYDGYTLKRLKQEKPEDYKAIIDAVLTAAFMASSWAAYAAMFSDTDDDDTMKKFWKRYFVDNPSQFYNPVDIIRNPNQLLPVAWTRVSNMGTSFGTMMGAIVMYGASGGDVEQLYTQRGDLRGWNDFKKGIPYIAPAADFIQKMENQDIVAWEEDDNFRRP